MKTLKSIKLATTVALASLAFHSVAHAASTFLWSNSAGYTSPDGCDVISLPQPRFTVVPKSGASFQLGRNVIKVGDASEKVADTNFDLQGSFWQPEGNDETFLTFNCPATAKLPARQYLIFDVFTLSRVSAIARVGISADDLGFLNGQPVYHSEDAQKLIAGKSATSIGVTRLGVAVAPTPVATATPAPVPIPKPVPKPPPRPVELKPKPTPDAQSNAVDAGTVVCVADSEVPVFADDLKTKLFVVRDLDPTKLYQNFDGQPTRKFSETQTIFVKLQFPNQKTPNVGWIEEDELDARTDCKYQPMPAPVEKPIDFPGATAQNEDPDACCNFPMASRPSDSYLDGMRAFGARRDGGKRVHAACDLYRPNGEDVKAVASGQVVRGKYYFYQGVYAIEVRHVGGFIGRYGEVLGKDAPGITAGSKVIMGQTVGYVGTVNSHCCSPMMHFELYSGKAKGSLTVASRKGYQRRADLVNPTKYLQKWEYSKFGAYYTE